MTVADIQDAPVGAPVVAREKLTLAERAEAFVTRLSARNNFWNKVCSLVWLPYAFKSGITMRRINANSFRAVLPFKRGNRNFYNAMAGAALLGNSEVAAGMHLFSRIGADYVVVCKDMRYRFLRPCYGPAIYHVTEREKLDEMVAAGGEFNVALDMDIRQHVKRKGREVRVGKCEITFHCTPKADLRAKAARAARDD